MNINKTNVDKIWNSVNSIYDSKLPESITSTKI